MHHKVRRRVGVFVNELRVFEKTRGISLAELRVFVSDLRFFAKMWFFLGSGQAETPAPQGRDAVLRTFGVELRFFEKTRGISLVELRFFAGARVFFGSGRRAARTTRPAC